MMSSGYTCLRCLTAEVLGPVGRRSHLQSARGKRWVTASSKPLLSLSRPTRLGNISTQSRGASSVGYREQDAKNEPEAIPSPVGLTPSSTARPLLLPNNLFHSFSNSPSPDIRRRAAFIRQHAYCPHPSHHQTRLPTAPGDPEARKTSTSASLPPAHVKFECPDCGIPISCSEEHWADDYASHLELCDTLREINEDDHDLRSERFFPEFEYPGPQIEEALVNMTNWDTYLYSREYTAINEARSMRHATKVLTYPLTIGSVLHELSPYNIRRGGRLTIEGLKSLSGKFCRLMR